MEKITITNPQNSMEGAHVAYHEVASLADVSDGYHTIAELYDHRVTLFLALCSTVEATNFIRKTKIPVWRSKKHSDGTGFDGWFVLGMCKEPGKQMTYHLPDSQWDACKFAETLDCAPEFDGHTSADVLARITSIYAEMEPYAQIG